MNKRPDPSEPEWHDPAKEKPQHAYDLVQILVTDTSLKEPISIPGWWTGSGWDGYRIKPSMKVLGWKRRIQNVSS